MALLDLLDRNKNEPIPSVQPDELEIAEVTDDELEPDPKPSRVLEGVKEVADKVVKTRAKVRTQAKLTKLQKQKILDKFEIMVKMPGMFLGMVDPVCGGALANNSMSIAESMIPIISRNPEMLAWFLSDSTGAMMDYMGVLWACMPVGMTVYNHHFGKNNVHSHEEEEIDVNFNRPEF